MVISIKNKDLNPYKFACHFAEVTEMKQKSWVFKTFITK
jgi:hypothetical protein